jgi:hypothetical protein
MNLEQAKIICLAHIEYVLNGTKNDYTIEEIGEAIHYIAISVKPICEYNYNTLMKYNQWRRGEIENYPTNSTHNMNILKESVTLL